MNIRAVQPNDPPHLKAMFSILGLSEIAGPQHERRVLAMYAACGHPEINNDEVPWCAAGVGWCLVQASLPLPPKARLMARSYAKYGRALDTSKILPRGAICVFPRGKPPAGHVNLLLRDDGTWLTCIGCNQANGKGGGVTIAKFRKSDLLAARMPAGVASKPKPVAPIPPPPDIEPVPQEPAKDMGDLKNSRTVAGGVVATGGTAGTAAAEAAQQIEPLAEFSTYIKFLFVGLTLAGIGWMIYARWDDAGRPLPWKGKK
jgi:uncharacterized protein (TIGR02594 family)